MRAFADRLIESVDRFGVLCVGIDPHAGRVPALFGGDTPEGLERWGLADPVRLELLKGRT